jgi:hypothetical protein
MTVKATREGLVGKLTASGWKIDTTTLFVALPSRLALNRFVTVTNPLNGKTVRAEVKDVGPWNIHDNAYIFGGARPMSESGWKISPSGVMIKGTTNGAGIDLGEAVWNELEMKDNGDVEWDFTV